MAEHRGALPARASSGAIAAAAVVVALALAVSLAFGGLPAGAHSEAGEMTVIVAEQTGPGTVRVEVGITYVGDGHLAGEASVSVAFAGSGGPSLTAPVTLSHISGGRYGGDVQLAPGTWEANIASVDPTASATAALVVSPDFTTTTAPPTTTTTTAAPTVVVDGSSGSSWIGPAIGVAVALALGGAVGVLLAFRKRPPTP